MGLEFADDLEDALMVSIDDFPFLLLSDRYGEGF